MAKVKIQGHASGTGILTVTAPNTSTDRTITLPDETATLSTFDPDGAQVFNESGADVDFRVEGSGEANALFVQGSDGNVGIGVSSPQELLHIKDGSIAVGNGTASNNAQVGRIGFSTDSSNSRFIGMECYRGGDAANGDLRFHTYGGDGDAGERLRITNDGNVGIGTTSPSELFTVSSSTASSYNYQSISGGNQPDHFVFKSTNTVVGSITRVGGSGVAYNTSSDYRLKENVVPMTGSIDRLKELKPSKFNFITDADTTVDGFLAHEAQEVVPEAITGEKDAMRTEEYEVEPAIEATYDEEGNELTPAVEAVMGEREVEDYQGIDQSKLVPLLTSALQEAVAKIEELTTRIETLEAN